MTFFNRLMGGRGGRSGSCGGVKSRAAVLARAARFAAEALEARAYLSVDPLDPTFGSGGSTSFYSTALSRNDAGGIFELPSGKILIAGQAETPTGPGVTGLALVRLNADGGVDSSFADHGKLTVEIAGLSRVTEWAQQPDGKFVAAGKVGSAGAAMRLNADLTLDTSFGINGVAAVSQITGNGAESLTLDASGRIILVGAAGNDMGIARLTTGGALDAAFGGGDGVATVDYIGQPDVAKTAALQSDGKIVIGGWTKAASTVLSDDFALVRLNTDGSLDTTFGSGGKVNTDFKDNIGSSGNEHVNEVAIAADGKIVAAGDTSMNGYTGAVARYNADGSLDTTFDGDGRFSTTFSSKSDAYDSVVVLGDGSLLLGGTDDANVLRDFTIEKLTPGGSMDLSFGGGDGKLTFDFGAGSDFLHKMKLAADGKILAVGQATGSSDGSFMAVARANTDGSADTSFGTGGKTQVAVAGWAATGLVSLSRDPSGRLVAGVIDNRNRLPVIRLTADGKLDPTFGSGGRASFALFSLIGAADRITTAAATVQSDGKVLAAGTQKNGGYAVGRYNADGTIDTTFGASGLALGNPASTTAVLKLESIAVQPDGKILIGGSSSGTYWAVTRLNTDGSVDSTFGDAGSVRFDTAGVFSTSIGGAHGLAVAPDGSIIAVGNTVIPNDSAYLAVVRLTPAGALDTTFDSDGVRLVYQQPANTPGSTLRGVVVRPDGRIVAGGNENTNDFVLYQLNTDGSFDSTFGVGGRVATAFVDAGKHYNTSVNSLALRADGLLAASGTAISGATTRSTAAYYDGDGTLHSLYGVGGKQLTGFAGAAGIVFDSNDRVVVAGSSNDTVAIASRYSLKPIIEVQANDGVERNNPNQFPVFGFLRSGDLSAPLALSLTWSGTAAAGVDYQSPPSTVTFPAGESFTSITVTPIDDVLYEQDETITATIADVPGYMSAMPSATAILHDDEFADANEPNETAATAYPFPAALGVLGANASLHTTTDVDYYSLVVTDAGLRAALTSPAGAGTVELDVFDSSQNVVGHSAVDGSTTQLITLPSAAPGTYYIRVRGGNGVSGYVGYNLAAETRRPYDATATSVRADQQWTSSASRFDFGGEGLSFHDTTSGNTGSSPFRNGYGVDLRTYKPTGSTAKAISVTDTFAGEWLNYTIDVVDATSYVLTTRAGTLAAGSTFHYELDGSPLTGSLNVPVTADMNAMQSVATTVNLPTGRHALRLVIDSSSGAGSAGDFDSITLSPAMPSVQIKVNGYLNSREPEPTTPSWPVIAFNITRVGPTDAALTVHYTLSGTMTAGDDYIAPSGDVVIPAGAATSATVQVQVNSDFRYEDTETLTVRLSPSVEYTIGPSSALTFRVDDYRPTKTAYEPNETLATAAPTLGVWPQGTHIIDSLAPSDVDYYRCSTIATDGTMTANLTFASKYGDLYLVAYDAAGSEIARSDTVGDSETITFPTGPIADYYFGVFGKDGASNGQYHLDLSWTETNNPVASFYPIEQGQYPVNSVPVLSNETLFGMDLSDFRLTRDGVPVAFTSDVRMSSSEPGVEGLSGVTAPGGKYKLTLVAAGSGIHDLFGNPLLQDASLTWVNSAPMPARMLPILADAYVRGGTSSGANFGTDALLQAGGPSAGGDETRESYIRIDLSSLDPEKVEASAYLRLFGKVANPTAAGIPITVVPVFDNGWTEASLNYSNRPPAIAPLGSTDNVNSADGAWYEFNVTDYIQQAKAAGATSITFVVKSSSGTTGTNYVNFNSSQAADHQPELQVNENYVRLGAILSPDSVSVPEGGTTTIDVRLNRQPTKDVIVHVGRQSGDIDLDVSGDLSFTRDNWNVPQHLVFTAAEDADAIHGFAAFYLATDNIGQPWIAVNEVDNDAALVTDVVNPGTDLTVSDGSTTTRAVTTTATELVVRKSNTAGLSREAYVKFDLTRIAAASNLQSVKVRLFGKTSASGSVPVGLFPVLSSTWSPSATMTWSTRPATASTPAATRTISGTTGAWYDFDVTAYIIQQKLAGAKAVSFALRGTSATTISAVFNSNEASSNRPALNAVKKTILPQEALVVSATKVSVKEGGSATFTVKLAAAPTSNVVVTIDRTGDTDLSASPVQLTFTPSNWNTAQTVSIKAAQDADTIGGSASFAVSAPGLPVKTVTATELDDDGLKAAITSLRAVADAYVRNGTYAAQNFGGTTDLAVRKSTTAGNARETYLKFDLSTVSGISSAKLRLYGKLAAAAAGVQIGVYSSTNTSWTNTGVTWNTKPAAGATAVTSFTVSSTTAGWYEIDLTSFIKAEKAAGHKYVTLALKAATSEITASFTSDNATANRPALVVT